MSPGHYNLVNPRANPACVVQLVDYEHDDDYASIPHDVILYD